MPVSKTSIRGHFRVDAKGNASAKSIGQSSYAAVGAGVGGAVEELHEASWSLSASDVVQSGLATEGSRREDAEA